MKNITIYLGLVFVFTIGIVLFSNENDKSAAGDSKIECDLKNVQNFYYCENDGKLLRGFECPTCRHGKCDWYKTESEKLAKSMPPPSPGACST